MKFDRIRSFGLRMVPLGAALGCALTMATAVNAQQYKIRLGHPLTTSDNALTMFPPLNIERRLVEEGLKILERCAPGTRS